MAFLSNRFLWDKRNIVFLYCRTISTGIYPKNSGRTTSSVFYRSCVDNYDVIVNSLQTDRRIPLSIPPNTLAFIPLVSNKIIRPNEFVENTLTKWWRTFQPICNGGQIHPSNFTQTINGLRQLNENTNGEVVKILGWKPFEQLSFYGMSDVRNLTCRHISTILSSLVIVQEHEHCGEKPSDEFKLFLTNSLTQFFDFVRRGDIQYADDLKDYIHLILRNCQQLGVEKLPADCLTNILRVYSENFKIWRSWPLQSSEMGKVFKRLGQFHALATTFLRWNVDGDAYLKNFWDVLFYEISYCLDKLDLRRGNRFRAQLMSLVVRITLQFDKRQQFLDNRAVLRKHIKLNCQVLTDDELKEILEYCPDGLVELENLSKDLAQLISVRILSQREVPTTE